MNCLSKMLNPIPNMDIGNGHKTLEGSYEILMLGPALLNIDDGRPIHQKLLDALSVWDESQLTPLEVNFRPDGTVHVIRGKHRTLKCREHIKNGKLPAGYVLPCRPHYFATVAEEIAYRKRAEGSQRDGKWTAKDEWADRQLTDVDARRITELFALMGATIGATGEGHTHFGCVTAAENVYRKADGLLGDTLTTFRDSGWLGTPQTNTSKLLEAVARFVYTCNGAPSWNLSEAALRLRKTGFQTVRRYAREITVSKKGPQADDFCAAMVRAYNDHSSGRGRSLVRPVRPWSD